MLSRHRSWSTYGTGRLWPAMDSYIGSVRKALSLRIIGLQVRALPRANQPPEAIDWRLSGPKKDVTRVNHPRSILTFSFQYCPFMCRKVGLSPFQGCCRRWAYRRRMSPCMLKTEGGRTNTAGRERQKTQAGIPGDWTSRGGVRTSHRNWALDPKFPGRRERSIRIKF